MNTKQLTQVATAAETLRLCGYADTAKALDFIIEVETAPQRLRELAASWEAKEIDKFEFYDATKGYRAELVAKVADIPVHVVRDRRRYLRQLAKQGKGA